MNYFISSQALPWPLSLSLRVCVCVCVSMQENSCWVRRPAVCYMHTSICGVFASSTIIQKEMRHGWREGINKSEVSSTQWKTRSYGPTNLLITTSKNYPFCMMGINNDQSIRDYLFHRRIYVTQSNGLPPPCFITVLAFDCHGYLLQCDCIFAWGCSLNDECTVRCVLLGSVSAALL